MSRCMQVQRRCSVDVVIIRLTRVIRVAIRLRRRVGFVITRVGQCRVLHGVFWLGLGA